MGVSAEQASGKFADLRTRLITAVLAGSTAFFLLYLGGFWAALLIAAMAGVMLWEWRSITLQRGKPSWANSAVLVIGGASAILVEYLFDPLSGLVFLGLVVAGAALADIAFGRRQAAGWGALGGLYLGLSCIGFFWLRDTDPFGFLATVWIVCVVIATDVGGYFAGRMIGGPKLWPRISPKKTWAGLGGGVVLAFLVGGVFSWATVGTYFEQVCAVSAVAAVLAQGGDLAESAVKRHFGVKDSSRILPGHGGVLDRLDGLTAAVLVAATVTLWRGQTVFIW